MAAAPIYTVPKEQASALLGLALTIPFAKAIVGKPGQQGIRFVIGKLFALENYVCLREPVLEPYRGLRLVLWKTPEQHLSSRWRKIPGIFILPGRTRGVGSVHPGYRKDWKGNSRRTAELHEREGVILAKAPLSEFAKAYHSSGHLDPFLRYGMLKVTKDHLKVHPENVHILLGRQDGQIVGGAIFVDFPDIKTSSYIASFLTEEGRKQSYGYAFIDWWYKNMLTQGIFWADFGIMWQPGDPRGWQGSSSFKKHFRPTLHTFRSYWKVG